MPHTHRLEIRITVPRRAPVKIEVDAQDVAFADPDRPRDASARAPGEGWLALPV